jgi:hypothetical protein
MPPVTPQIALTGNLDDLFGAPLAGSGMFVQLVNFANQVPRINGTAILAQIAPIEIDCPAGTFSFSLWGNDVIVPGGTYYVFQIVDDNQNVINTNAYQFAGVVNADLSTIVPYNPNILVVPPGGPTVFGQLVTIPFAANMAIPGNIGTAFDITLTGDVLTDVMNNVQPGTLYTFIIVQDGVGNHAWVWPNNVVGAEPPNNAAGSITTQTFISRANGYLYPVGPAIYS